MLIRHPHVPAIIGAAIEVHRAVGPGLFESAYEEALAHEFSLRRIEFRRQVSIPFQYKNVRLGHVYRLDFLVHGVAIELKSVDSLLPLHDAQLLAYMRMLKCTHGLLFNFNVTLLTNGIRSFVL